jgi:hypothetical protein
MLEIILSIILAPVALVSLVILGAAGWGFVTGFKGVKK